jgi:hypothetical protein
MRNFEARREAQANRLLRMPINENPFEKCSGNQITLVRKIVEAMRASACKVEMVKHMVDFRGSLLGLRAWSQTLDTPTVLLSLLIREKEIPINLLRTKSFRKIASNRTSRDPEISRKSSVELIHEPMSSLERLFGKRCVCYYVREVRRSEPLDVTGAEVPKNIVKAGRRFAANDVAKGQLELVLEC